jgi:hypothetical protein
MNFIVAFVGVWIGYLVMSEAVVDLQIHTAFVPKAYLWRLIPDTNCEYRVTSRINPGQCKYHEQAKAWGF